MKLTELLAESQQLTEKTKPKTSNALGSMVDQLTGKNKSSDTGTTDQAAPAAAPAPNFRQGNYGQTTVNAPTGLTPQQPDPTQQPAQPAANFGQGGYGQTTVNAPTGLTPQQNLPTAQPAPQQQTTQEPQQAPAQQQQPAQEPQQAPAQQQQPAQEKKPGLLQRIGQGAGEFMYGYRHGAGEAPPGQQSNVAPTAGADQPAGAAPTASVGTEQPAQASSPYMQIRSKVDQLDKKGKQRILATLQKELGITPAAANAQPAPAAGAQALDLDQFKQQQAQAQAAGQADQQQAIQQMQATSDANAASAAERSNIEKAGKAAAAVPAFQRSASDKLAIKQAKEQGIKVETKKNKKSKKSLKESRNFLLPFSLYKK
jgi:hypothetical protein